MVMVVTWIICGIILVCTFTNIIKESYNEDWSKEAKCRKAEAEAREKAEREKRHAEWERVDNLLREAFKNFKGEIKVQQIYDNIGLERYRVLDFDRTFLNHLTLDLGLNIIERGYLGSQVEYVLEHMYNEHLFKWYVEDDGTELLVFDPDALICPACGSVIDNKNLKCPYCGTVYY